MSSRGNGRTELSAFDNALFNAGVHNYNLLLLSSVIPKGANVIPTKIYQPKKNEHGYKLYVVQAQNLSSKQNAAIGSSVGWYMLDSGGGFFVEHHSNGETTKVVEEKLLQLTRKSMEDLLHTRKMTFNDDQLMIETSVAQVGQTPTCTLVTAVYTSTKW